MMYGGFGIFGDLLQFKEAINDCHLLDLNNFSWKKISTAN